METVVRGDVAAIRAAMRMVGISEGPGCQLCGRGDISPREELCGRCRREFRPTPLDLVLTTLGLSPRAFAELTGLPVRTVIRATKGERMSRRVAERLAKVTRLPPATFRPELPR